MFDHVKGIAPITIAVLAMFGTIESVQADDWYITGASVTEIQGSYMPNGLPFKIDVPAGVCAAGSWLSWNGELVGTDSQARVANIKVWFAMLMMAKSTGAKLTLGGDNNCAVKRIVLE